MTESVAGDKVQVALRLDKKVLDAIDGRAKDVGLSRNEWMERAARWVIHNLPYGVSGAAREKAMRGAPEQVKGLDRVDMGLDEVEGR